MNSIKTFLSAVAALLLMTSCLGDTKPYNAGFSFGNPVAGYYQSLYANTVSDSLIFVSYGPWQITCSDPAASWCTIPTLSGQGGVVYGIPVTFQLNTSGTARSVSYAIVDTDHPSDASASWGYLQSATRGDGSMGNAPLVTSIVASDGYVVSFAYDDLSRPVRLVVTRPDNTVADELNVTYNDRDSLMTATLNNRVLRGVFDKGYQAQRLTGQADTVGYYAQQGYFGTAVSFNYAFNFEARRQGGAYQAYAYLLNGQNLAPDSIHNADSIVYQRYVPEQATTLQEKFKLTYGPTDNRRQSVDVNQLVLGLDDTHPMLLLPLFRYARNTNVVSQVTTSKGVITVTPELNGDKSVSRLTVNDGRKGTTVTYEFKY